MTDRIQQPVACGVAVFLDHDQRLVHETREHVELAVAHGFDGGEVEVSGERSEAPEQLTLGLVEQLVAPIERRGERLLTRQRGSSSSGQNGEGIPQTLRDLRWCQDSDSRGRQFDRQWDAVDAAADLRYRSRVLAGHCER